MQTQLPDGRVLDVVGRGPRYGNIAIADPLGVIANSKTIGPSATLTSGWIPAPGFRIIGVSLLITGAGGTALFQAAPKLDGSYGGDTTLTDTWADGDAFFLSAALGYPFRAFRLKLTNGSGVATATISRVSIHRSA